MPVTRIPGRSIVTRRAVLDVVRAAVLSSYGVTGLAAPGLATKVLRRVGLAHPGIRVSLDDGLTVELHLVVAHGLPVAEVVRQVESAVRYSLRRALGRDVDAMVVHVNGLRFQHQEAPPQGSRPTGLSDARPALEQADAVTPTAPAAAGGPSSGTASGPHRDDRAAPPAPGTPGPLEQPGRNGQGPERRAVG